MKYFGESVRGLAIIGVLFAYLGVAGAADAPLVGAPNALGNQREMGDLKKLRDPFKRPSVQEQDVEERSELETIPITDFTMTGILTGPKKTRAILRAGTGKVFVVSDGMKIGLQNGYIRKILEDRIIVNESVIDVLGEKEIVTQEIRMLGEKPEKAPRVSATIVSPQSANSEASQSEPASFSPPPQVPAQEQPGGAGQLPPQATNSSGGGLALPDLKDTMDRIQKARALPDQILEEANPKPPGS